MYICIYDICSILLNGHDSGTEKMEVPIVYKAVVSSLCRGDTPQNMGLYSTVPPFQDPKILADI